MTLVTAIETFKGNYRFLSNFTYFDRPMSYGNLEFPTVEHFYVAMKTTDNILRKTISNHPIKGLKQLGSGITLRDDWESIKLDVMLYALRYKFSNKNPRLRKLLLDTNDLYIQEGNWWEDKFWGYCFKTEVGENNLGKLLMQVREEIR